MKKRIFDSIGFNVEKLPHFFHTLYALFTVLDFSFNSNVTVSSVAHVSFCQIASRSEIRKNLILTVQKFTNWVHNCAFSEFYHYAARCQGVHGAVIFNNHCRW